MKCDIVMVTWNEAQITEKALRSIRDHTQYPYRLIVVDNASDTDTVALLERAARSGEFGPMVLIRNGENLGWVMAANQGLARTEAPYVCLINNDIAATPGWLRTIVAVLETRREFGLANPLGQRKSGPAVSGRSQDFTELDYCSGFCMVIKREVIERIGYLEEIYRPGYFDDNDYSRKAQNAGYLCIRCDDAYVYHHRGTSFKKLPEARRQLMERNQKIFEERWGVQRGVLVLPRCPDRGNLLALARRGHKLYVVRNRFFGPSSLPHPHGNIKFLNSPLGAVGQAFHFLWKAFSLARKGRIDQAVIQFGDLEI